MNMFNADANERGGSPFGMNPASPDQRGGMGANGQQPHSASGFRRALMRTARTSGRLKDQLPNKTSFGGKGFAKPSYFAQGGQRHGLHMGSGAPFTGAARQEGFDGE
jgi:hypothetical protein